MDANDLPTEIKDFVRDAKHLSTLQELHINMGVEQGTDVQDVLDTMVSFITTEITSCYATLEEIKNLRQYAPDND